MDLLTNNGFKLIESDMYDYLLSLRKDLTPLLSKYAGMGYYYILLENLVDKYVILMVGGPNGYDFQISEDNYKQYNGKFYSINECIKYTNYLINP